MPIAESSTWGQAGWHQRLPPEDALRRGAPSTMTHAANCRCLDLFDFVTARPKHRQQTIWTTHMARADDHEVCPAAAQIIFDFWKPVPTAYADKSTAKRWKITKGVSQHLRKRINIAAAPRLYHVVTTRSALSSVDKQDQQERLRFTIA